MVNIGWHYHKSDMAQDIPSAVLSAYQISGDADYERISSGLINHTWLVQDGQRRLVLQQLNPIFDVSVNETVDRVSRFLSDGCARTTTLLRTIDDAAYIVNRNDCWRCLDFVAGQTYLRMPTEHHAVISGQTLANFHAAMREYPERHTLPSITVHDLSFHRDNLIAALESYRRHRHHAEIRAVAAEILSCIEQLPDLPSFPLVVVHGDPKISNFIFDNSAQTACMIDLDTVGRGQLLSELGDAFRSWCNPSGEDTDKSQFELPIFIEAIQGYFSVSDTPMTAEQGQYVGIAIEMICLELAARFCADALKESYFAWDQRRFTSASEHQLLRARGQLCLAKSVGAQQASIARAVEAAMH